MDNFDTNSLSNSSTHVSAAPDIAASMWNFSRSLKANIDLFLQDYEILRYFKLCEKISKFL